MMRLLGSIGVLTTILANSVCAQTITGRITIGNSGLGLRGGAVVLVDLSSRIKAATRADSSGRFSVLAPLPGSYRLRVQGPDGITRVETKEVALASGQFLEMNVVFPPAATLDTIRVSATRPLDAPNGNRSKYDEFYRRRELGFGQFMTKTDIEKLGVNQTTDLLRKVHGMLVRQSGTKVTIQSQRCGGSSIPGYGKGSLGGGIPDSKQEPMLFVDGHRVRGIESLEDIHPNQIEAMEVYQGAAEVPAEAKGDACAAIFIWLKAGSDANR